MKLLTNLLSTIVASAFTECGYDAVLGQVAVSDRLDLCQFQCNGAFSGAKLYKKTPFAIANEVVSRIQMNDMLEKAEVVPPGFINITIKDEFLFGYVEQVFRDEHKGIPQTEHPETIVLDYGNPNVAKPLHVGHLRSAIIGEALKRIIISTGRTAIGDVHLGDWGLPMGLVLAELEERHGDHLPPLTVDLLNEIYPFASKKSKADGVFLEKARKVTVKLQKGYVRYTKIWREMVDISIKDIRETFGRLNVSFDHWYGESDSSKYVPELIKILTDKNLLVQSEGAEVVNVAMECDKAVIPPTIIVKSNGSEGYATTDIATILQRQRDFKPDKILYVVDFRQNLHFTQVFRTARKAELIPDSTELAHLCFGTVNGRDGKPFKTRDGGVMQLSELLDTVISCSYDKLRFHEVIGEADKKETAKKIGIAAIKFGDLINHYSKDCIFDMEKFMAAEGKTGVYLLYMVARIHSILKKVEDLDVTSLHLNGIYSNTERELMIKLALSGYVFINAYNEKAPNMICESAYQIAVAFSRFYHENHILSEKDEQKKSSWLALCLITKDILKMHLNTLAIDTVEFM
ncbi:MULTISPECIES: arginine--tRNA ligase [Hungatella]|uniref:arginine--tRNA ligase n=1 Tax=Hungatella TaxID=1649459 RepID=UPI0006C1082F|nr:arginine--tRNA ligase [Hungatella hathewayi]MCQ4827917.1 arginine--tRNA ligase [Hungatella sp. SL.1.14]CUQ03271.1 arginine--tRNA ligase ArgS [Hungatella hathewayi]